MLFRNEVFPGEGRSPVAFSKLKGNYPRSRSLRREPGEGRTVRRTWGINYVFHGN